jgi:MFS family permease
MRRLLVSTFFYAMAMNGVCIMIPQAAKDLGANENLLSWIGLVFAFGYVLSCQLSGRLSDRLGRKAFAIGAILSNVALMGALAIRETRQTLFVAGFLAALFQGFFWPQMEAWLCHGISDEESKKMLGRYCLSWSTGSAIGPGVAGYLHRWGGESGAGGAYCYLFLAAVCLVSLFPVLGVRDRVVSHAQTSAPENGDAPPADARRLLVRVALVVNLVYYGSVGIVRNLLPRFIREYGMGIDEGGYLGATTVAVQAFTFYLLTHWRGWKYRMGFYLWAQALAAACLLSLALFPSRPVFYGAFFLVGFPASLIYFSSIFYAVDATPHEKGKYAGHHETMIGAGLAAGPATGFLVIPLRRALDLSVIDSLRIPYLLAALAFFVAVAVQYVYFRRKRLFAVDAGS